ncbi:ankyrin repeat domain-containing protein [Sodalis ligni]|uniref:Ankyrin repeat protein n=1 Tax=Sodalis ligni TaxID=2697027 RepID=A0A4R1NFV2_9GAMM|nr:ankyrin repeat domain-containing protein [Sodalis ligni]TCL06544.1 ankyrin repeat protein [Sodalis ligni]
MNVTLQPYAPSRLIDFSQPSQPIESGKYSSNYTSQIQMLSNNILPMINAAEKRFGNNSTELRAKRHIADLKEKGLKVNPNQARLGCLDHKDKRASLPESTVDVDIEYLDPKTVTRPNVNDKNQDGLTPLMRIALTGGNSEDIKSLIRLGANVGLQDNAGNTALMWVVKSLFRLANETRIQIKLSILDVLINSAADLNLADKEGFTPLMIAAMGDDKSSFKKLLINKATVELKNNDGKTALHLAVEYNASNTIIDQLCVFYQKLNVDDKKGRTPFMIASYYGNLALMDSFFNKGVDVDHVDVNGWTALMHAVDCRKEEVVKKLCSYGANVNFTTLYQRSALLIAFEKKDKIMALALIKAGAVMPNEEIKHWLKDELKENVNTNHMTWQVIANDNNVDLDSNTIDASDEKDETIVVKPILQGDFNDDTAETNSSQSSGSSYLIPGWLVYKMKSAYEAFKRYASPFPPLS